MRCNSNAFAPRIEWEYNRWLTLRVRNKTNTTGGQMNVRTCLCAGAAALAMLALAIPDAYAQAEVSGATTSNARPISTPMRAITQQMLDAAASDPKNWIHPNSSYDQQRF